MVSTTLRLILFITITAVQFFIPFVVLHWGFGLDDFMSLVISWGWAIACIIIVTTPDKGVKE